MFQTNSLSKKCLDFISHDLCNNFVADITEANGAELGYSFWGGDFGNQRNQSFVDPFWHYTC